MTRLTFLSLGLGIFTLSSVLVLPAAGQERVAVETIKAPVVAARIAEPEYWIGLHCQPVTDELRAALKLDAGLGLVVETVVPQSPADQAGLRSGDIVLALGERVNRVEQLALAASKAQAGVIRVQILRDGRVQGVEVKPAPRPSQGQLLIIGNEKKATVVAGEPGDTVLKQIEVRREAVREGDKPAGGETYEYRIKVAPPVVPGIPKPPIALPRPVPPPMAGAPATPGAAPNVLILRSPAGGGANLPENMKVTVDKKGSHPAIIIAEQGDKMWKTNENEMEMLPAEARAYASRLLGRPGAIGVGPAAFPATPGGGAFKTFEFKLDDKGQGTPAIIHARPHAGAAATPAGEFHLKIREPEGPRLAPSPEVHRLEIKLPQAAPPNRPDHELREIEAKIQMLRREIEKLRKSVDDD